MKLKKTLLLTGTSRGIGKQTAILFLKAGHRVVGISRKKDEQLCSYPNYTHHSINLSNLEAIGDFIHCLEPIDWVIHNAGSLTNKPFVELTPTDFQKNLHRQCFCRGRTQPPTHPTKQINRESSFGSHQQYGRSAGQCQIWRTYRLLVQ